MDIKNRIKEKLNESLQTKRAKQAGLKHVGHGIYKSNDGHFFRFDTFDGTFYNISLDREESQNLKVGDRVKVVSGKDKGIEGRIRDIFGDKVKIVHNGFATYTVLKSEIELKK